MTPDVVDQRRAIRARSRSSRASACSTSAPVPVSWPPRWPRRSAPDGRVHGVDPSESMLADRPPPRGARRVRHRRRARAALPGRALRRRGLHAGVRVRRRHRRGAGRGAAGAAPRRPAARAGHRLGLDRLALARPRADGARARRLERAPRRPLPAAAAPGLLRGAGLEPSRRRPIIPILNLGADRNTYSAGMIEIVAGFVAGRGGVTEADAAAWAAGPRRASATTTSSASTATCSWRSAGDRCLGRGLAVWQLPARPREVAGVAVRVALEVVLVVRFGLPERHGLADLGHDLAGPQA